MQLSNIFLCMCLKTPFQSIHSYITHIIGHYNPLVRIIDLVSYTTYVVCVNFIHKWRALQFKVDYERQIFWETFHGNFIYSQSNLLRGNRRRNTFRISFWCLAWDSNPGFSSNKPTHYLLDQRLNSLTLLNKKNQYFINNNLNLFREAVC